MHGAEALHRLGGPAWDTWRKAIADALTFNQRGPETGCRRGSWDPSDPWCPEGGRVWMTSASLLALEQAADEPGRRPQMTAGVRSATWALDKATKSPDARTRMASIWALQAIRGVYR
jgi:hypothetical protein